MFSFYLHVSCLEVRKSDIFLFFFVLFSLTSFGSNVVIEILPHSFLSIGCKFGIYLALVTILAYSITNLRWRRLQNVRFYIILLQYTCHGYQMKDLG